MGGEWPRRTAHDYHSGPAQHLQFRRFVRVLTRLYRGCGGAGCKAQNPDSNPILEAWLAKNRIYLREKNNFLNSK